MFSAFQTFGRLGAGARAVAAAWSPLALWPTGTEPGMWIDPSNLASQWQDYTGTTPVATPGTVADSSNPVGLAYDLRAGTYALGSELLTNGDFSDGKTGWIEVLAAGSTFTVSGGEATLTRDTGYAIATQNAFTPGKQYEYTVEIVSISGTVSLTNNVGLYYASFTTPGIKTVRFTHQIEATAAVFFGVDTDGGSVVFDNVSAKEILGNHLFQATSTARPLLSARVNLLTYTEDFSNAVWQSGGVTLTPAAAVAPDGTTSAYSCSEGTGTSLHYFLEHQVAYVTGQTYSFSIFAKKVDSKYVRLFSYSNAAEWMAAVFDLDTGLVAATDASGASWSVVSTSVSPAANGFVRLSVTFTSGTLTAADTGFAMSDSAAFGNFGLDPAYSGTSRSVYVWGAQVEYGGDAFDYQSVPGNGSSYPSTGFPIYPKYDGTDDGMATASFAAGTLSNAMDCMIAVRRDSGVKTICGIYNAANVAQYTGYAESGVSDPCIHHIGTPTTWVDGVQLAGGVAVTADTLHTALTIGAWHILEYRGLDLSLFEKIGYGTNYFGYFVNGGQGGILLFPSSTSTADRDAARTWLGAKVGLTL